MLITFQIDYKYTLHFFNSIFVDTAQKLRRIYKYSWDEMTKSFKDIPVHDNIVLRCEYHKEDDAVNRLTFSIAR